MLDETKVLIIGGSNPSSIGHAVAEAIWKHQIGSSQSMFNNWQVHTPNIEAMDVTYYKSVDAYIGKNGPFTHVVYSVGMQQLEFIDAINIDNVKEIYELNVFGFIRVLNSLLLHQTKGKVCAVVSNAATTPMRGSIAYCSSKAALEMAIKCAARELAPNWVITGVSPGPVKDTPMTKLVDKQVQEIRGWTAEYAEQYERSLIPMERRSTREEVAQLILSMLINSAMLTGQVVSITGGRT